jgi:hypothetical protein
LNFFAFCLMIWGCILVGYNSQKKSLCRIQDGVWCPKCQPKFKVAKLRHFPVFLSSVFYNAFVLMSATWIKSIFCQMSQKWRFDPKWRIKIRFFVITLRESNIFSIFFLHSFVVSETQILWKKVFQKSKMAAQTIFSFQQPSWIFRKTFFPQNLRLTNNKWMQKEDWKKLWILSELWQKIWFLSAILDRTAIFDSFDKKCSWFMFLTKIQTHCRRQTERKNTGKCLGYATLKFGRHIGQQTPSWIW